MNVLYDTQQHATDNVDALLETESLAPAEVSRLQQAYISLRTLLADEMARINHAYHEIQRRDGSAEWHTRCWRRTTCVVLAALMVSVAVIVYQARQASQVQAFVQTVQLTEDNRLVQVGMPMDLLAYTPQDGEYLTMLYEWLRLYRMRGDETGVRTKLDWDWLKQHTCGAASKELLRDEVAHDPYNPKKRNNVYIGALKNNPRHPATYEATWEEVRADKGLAKEEKRSHTATFTVARLRPKTLGLLMQNRLGLCVNGYAIDPRVLY